MRVTLVFPLISLIGCPSSPSPAPSTATASPSASTIASATGAPSTKPSVDADSSASALVAQLDKMQVATVGALASTTPSSSSTGAPPKADVKVGGLQGADTVPGAETVVAKTRSKFEHCYEKALLADAKAAGTIKLSIVVGANGNVDKLKVVSSSVSTALETCVVGAAGFMKSEQTYK